MLNKIIFDSTIDICNPYKKGCIEFALDTENTNYNDEKSITYCTSLIEIRKTNTKGNTIINSDDIVNIFTHPNIFWDFILNQKHPETKIYVFNADFDVENLFPFLLKKLHNLKEVDKMYTQNEYGIYEENKKYNYKNLPYTYNFVKSDNSIIMLTINLELLDKRTNKFRQIKIYDLSKRMTGTLADNVKAFLGYEMSKEGLDYSKFRDFFHRDYTENELKYIWEDTYYLKELVNYFVYELGNTSLTTGTNALNDYKARLLNDFKENYDNKTHINYEIYRRYFNSKIERLEYIKKNKNSIGATQLQMLDKYNKYINENGQCSRDEFIFKYMCDDKDLFSFIFPSVDNAMFTKIYASYKGGITRMNNAYFKPNTWINKEGHSYDINSSYPNSQRNFDLPYGKGILRKGKAKKKKGKVFLQHVRIRDFWVKPGKEPILQTPTTKYKNVEETWAKSFRGVIDYWLTNMELEYIIDNYEYGDLKCVEYIEFKAKKGLFNAFIDYHYSIKQTETGPIKSLSKLKLNSLYGKFGQNAVSEMRKTVYNQELNCIEDVIVKDDIGINKMVSVTQVYIPVATFVTAYSRLKLVNILNRANATRGIQWAYCDTDSVYLIGSEDKCNLVMSDELDKDNTGDLGLWKKEKDFIGINIIGIKKYLVKVKKDNQINYLVTLSGINRKYFKVIETDLLHNENIIGIINPNDIDILHNHNYYTIQDDTNPYLYYDKNCTKPIVGAYKSIRRIKVENGVVLIERIYCIKGGQVK